MTIYLCDDDRRRQVILGQAGMNGLDYLEVLDLEAPPGLRQQIFNVSFINAPAPAGIGPANVQIVGGERITGIYATSTSMSGNTLVVNVNAPGDYSEYTLKLVDSSGNEPYPGLDPALSEIAFSFKVECPSDFDCQSTTACAHPTPSPPEINYLAKDFSTFVTLMQNRISLLLPAWQETSPADIGVTLIELLAYVADRLSYRQDAIATEAYLATARQRISIRRHARLVDYAIQEGCNSRVWLWIAVNADVALPARTEFLTRIAGAATALASPSQALTFARQQNPQSFESMTSATLHKSLSLPINFHNWGGLDCCLPAGATSATLRGAYPDLKAGDVLIFQETRGRDTGSLADADPSRRVAVRLTKAQVSSDPVGGCFVPLSPPGPPPPLTVKPLAITEIEWMTEDALAFPIQITMLIENPPNPNQWVDSAVALGNIVLADNGRTVSETLAVPAVASAVGQPRTTTSQTTTLPAPPYSPQLSQAPLTFAVPLPSVSAPQPSASALFSSSPSDATPAIQLLGGGSTSPWSAVGDLLDSLPASADFVVEIDNASNAHLRFGDGDYGQTPVPGSSLVATYRIGVGASGNVGLGTIGHIVSADAGLRSAVTQIVNPLPAAGGVDPETPEHVRQSAPYAFRTQQRAVTPDDYASWLDQRPEIQNAAATFRWTGSWRTVFNTVEPKGTQAVDASYKSLIESYLEGYRVVGKDLEVDTPRFLALDIGADVCVSSGYFRADVEQALDSAFSSRPGGVFDPANFDFGQTVYLSPLYAAAQSVPGVASIEFTQFEPRGVPTRSGLATGFISLGRLEIARVANDPSFPERGQISFTMMGGQ